MAGRGKAYDGATDATVDNGALNIADAKAYYAEDYGEGKSANVLVENVTIGVTNAAYSDKDAGDGKTITFTPTPTVNGIGGSEDWPTYEVVSSQTSVTNGVIVEKLAELGWYGTNKEYPWGESVDSHMLPYNGQEQAPAAKVSNLVEGDECDVTVVGGGTEVTKSQPYYTATTTALSNSNYMLSGNNSVGFKIVQGDTQAPNPAPKADENLTYMGKPQALLSEPSRPSQDDTHLMMCYAVADITGMAEDEPASFGVENRAADYPDYMLWYRPNQSAGYQPLTWYYTSVANPQVNNVSPNDLKVMG